MCKKTQTFCFLMVLIMALPQLSAGTTHWTMDTVSDSFHNDKFHSKPIAFDEENNYHMLIGRLLNNTEPDYFEGWYTSRNAGQDWSSPSIILEEETPLREQRIVVTTNGEIVVATANPETDEIQVFVNDEDAWVQENIPFPHENEPDSDPLVVSSRYKYDIAADQSGALHLVWAANVLVNEDPMDYDGKLMYGSNATGEWEVHIFESLVPLYSQDVKMDLAPDGSAHIIYFNDETNQVHYLNNQDSNSEQDWVDIQLDTGHASDLLGDIIYQNDKAHVFVEYQDFGFFSDREILYFQIQDNETDEPVKVHTMPSALYHSAAVNSEGEIMVLYTEHFEHNNYGAFYIAAYEDEGFVSEQLLDEDIDLENAYIACDKEDDFVILLCMGEHASDIMMLEQGEELFEVEFIVADSEGSPLNDAVITLNGQQAEAGDYLFSDLEEGIYEFLVEKEGFYPYMGEVTIVDSDETVEVTLQEIDLFEVVFAIEDPEGSTIEDATIIFDGQQEEPGVYVFSDLEEGSYEYRIEKEGFFPYEGTVTVSDSDEAVEVTLQFDNTGFSQTERLSLNMYPNPASGTFTVSCPEVIEKIEIFDITGKKVKSLIFDKHIVTLETGEWKVGLYLIRVHGSENVFSGKMVVDR